MAEILTPTKALAVNPLKASQPIGASLAFLGLADCMPLEHGARGCTSFNKLFFMRHFNEPIALQTTAMDQTTTVLGADDNVVEALATICAKDRAESDRPDHHRAVGDARRRHAAHHRRSSAQAHPEFADVAVDRRSAPPTRSAAWKPALPLAVEAIIRRLVPHRAAGRQPSAPGQCAGLGDADARRHRRTARLDRGLRPRRRSCCPISATRSTAI